MHSRYVVQGTKMFGYCRTNMPSLIRFVYEVGSEAFIALAYRRVQTTRYLSEHSGTQGTTTRSSGQFSLNLGVVATVFCARRYSTRG